MRFDFRLTPEKLAALKAGTARLFFFARGEYRDEAGKTYSLPFAELRTVMPAALIQPTARTLLRPNPARVDHLEPAQPRDRRPDQSRHRME